MNNLNKTMISMSIPMRITNDVGGKDRTSVEEIKDLIKSGKVMIEFPSTTPSPTVMLTRVGDGKILAVGECGIKIRKMNKSSKKI